jgi:hypothetical protein
LGVSGFVENKSIINFIVPKSNMSFIRIKKIDGKEYAYLVENKWYKRKAKDRGRGSRQKVSRYLGRVYSFDKVNDDDFHNFKKINDLEQYLGNNKNKIIRELVEWELFRHNISNSEFFIDFSSKKIMKDKKEVSLKINEGFLNSYTLNRLFNLKSGNSYYLAKCFVEAGIEIPKEIFAGIFGR